MTGATITDLIIGVMLNRAARLEADGQLPLSEAA